MDYFGRVSYRSRVGTEGMFQSFWVNGLLWKLGIVGGLPNGRPRFQSFWVNGLLWKSSVQRIGQLSNKVSILLGQWITLEVPIDHCHAGSVIGFNPSGSMDYFGRPSAATHQQGVARFQSFWVNGLLWKMAD